ENVDELVQTAQRIKADLVVVGPELPLANGVVDRLSEVGIPAFGPPQAASRIEASKSFALDVMKKAGIPHPEFRVFREQQDALDFLGRHSGPAVVKADGLAAGKGVYLCSNREEAIIAVRSCMADRSFGTAGDTVVIEELLSGPEVSVFAFTDGEHISPLAAACDYKRLEDRDQGPNTGGMGSFAPPDFWTEALAEEINRTIIAPAVAAMAGRGTPYRGVLYAGLMLTETGPKVLEFNCRLGDPEAQVVLPRLVTDPLEIMSACLEGCLDKKSIKWGEESYVGVVMASGGYPARHATGMEITGLNMGEPDTPDTIVFHAATRLAPGRTPNKVVTSGGRVLTVVGRGISLAEARARAYDRVGGIRFHGAYYRTDIAAVVHRGSACAAGPVAPAG
ncbi:MAG: phosphoribosylamine--glycine ligase, partial [Chloroflexota bacterium]